MHNLAVDPPYELARPDDLHLDPEKVTAGLRAYFNIVSLWALSAEEARVVLGQPSRSTYFKWKKSGATSIPYDTLQRISYVLGIYKSLQILFISPEQADGWMRKPNVLFGSQSALQRMLAGDVTDLATVRNTLDAVRGLGG